ncbi:hypothetical protein JCM3775_006611 [Rhodotorula graminis]
MTPTQDDYAVFAPSGSPNTFYSTSTAATAPSPASTSSHAPEPASRKGRWTPSEHAEVLLTGDAAPPGASWDVLRRRMTGDARLRSAPALRARYLQLVRERRDREEEGAGAGAGAGAGEGDVPDLKVEEEGDGEDWRVPEGGAAARELSWSPPGTQSTSGDVSPPSRDGHKVHPAVVALPKPSLFRPPSPPNPSSISPSALSFPPAPSPASAPLADPHGAAPWSIDEDTALLTAMATPQLGAQTWAGMHALAARIYRLGPGEGREWTRSEREVQRRWDGVLRDGQFAPARWPDALVPPLVAIHALLTNTLQAQLDASDPRLAASLRAATLPRPLPAHPQSPSPAATATATATAPKPMPLGSPIRVKLPAVAAPQHSPSAPSPSPSTSTSSATRTHAAHLAPASSSSAHAHPALPLAQGGRAAPPFPARHSPLPGPSVLPRPPQPHTHTVSVLRASVPQVQVQRRRSLPSSSLPQPPQLAAATVYDPRPLPLSVPLGPAFHLAPPTSHSVSFTTSRAALSATAPASSARAHVHLPPMRLAQGPAPVPAQAATPDGAYGVLDLERTAGLGLGYAQGGGLLGARTATAAAAAARMGLGTAASWSGGTGVGAGADEGGAQGRKRALSVSVSAGAGPGWWWDDLGDAQDEGSAAKKARRESA